MLDMFNQNTDDQDAQQEVINNFFAEIEVCGGPTMSLRQLEKFVLDAPETVRKTRDFGYLIGLLFSRYMYEVVGEFRPSAQIGPYMPFDELEEHIMSMGEPEDPDHDPETCHDKMLRGFYDGRLIHEQLGGINNDDQDQSL